MGLIGDINSNVLQGSGLVAQSCLTLVIPRTVSLQALLSMGFPRQEHWSGLPFPSPGHLPDPGIKTGSLALQADSLLTELLAKPIPRYGVSKRKSKEAKELESRLPT